MLDLEAGWREVVLVVVAGVAEPVPAVDDIFGQLVVAEEEVDVLNAGSRCSRKRPRPC
ncbi:MAG: hypothetical protein WKF86_04180 [Acidimicrobiales bacterium]